jgi:hypothetical protein
MAYLRLFALSAVISFGLVWAWAVAMPMAFMDPEYPSWRAKQLMLARCDLGDVIILGDSRAAVDIVPAQLPIRATNLAVGGGKAIEAYAALTRVLACPSSPKLVIVSFDASHFTRPDLFWERSVRFGFLSAADVEALRNASLRIGDTSVYEARHTDGLPLIVRRAVSAPLPALLRRQPDQWWRLHALARQSGPPGGGAGYARSVLLRHRLRIRHRRGGRIHGDVPAAAHPGSIFRQAAGAAGGASDSIVVHRHADQ